MNDAMEKKASENGMMKLAAFIVDNRNLFFLILIIGLIFSAFSSSWVQVENSLPEYLPGDSETRQGLDIMEEQFTTYGTATVMVENISLNRASELHEQLGDIEGVQSVAYTEEDHYRNVSALFTITFDYSETDERCLEALGAVKAHLSSHDIYVSTALGNSTAEIIDQEVSVIMVIVAVIVVTVLIFTSSTYAEVPVLILTFVSAMILNQGTQFLVGKISFVSNSVTSILQLALSLDYAVILCNRFKEEREHLPLREAVITALSKGIPEITSSSLTTIGGMVAMMFMQFKLGPDMAICLIKAILFALLAVFLVMPGLLMLFGPWMEKTKHKSFVPHIPFVGKFAYKTRYIIPPVFVVLVLLGYHLSGDCPYVYGYGDIETPKQNYVQIAENKIADNFGATNFVALVYPKADYEIEKKLISELDTYEEVDYSMGLSNVEAMEGYMLADKLIPRQLAELAGLDYELAQVVFAAYGAQQGEYGNVVSNLATYKVPLIDMMLFVCDQIDAGLVSLEAEQMDMLQAAQTQMLAAKAQLQGEDYNRVLIYLNLPEGGDETYAFLDTIREIARKYYPKGNIYVVGDSSVEQDFKKSFATDNLVITIVSILIVLVVLLFTFKSAGMPLLLILVIQGAIWINFSIPAFTGSPLFFMSYLVVSSVQMGANIDYAIVIASRYQELKKEMYHRDAIIETMNFAFHTIITSGTIMACAGILIACQNNGDIYGRKDVGGIAVQIEPDIATILSPDYLQKLSDQFEQLGNLVSAAGSTASAAGSEFQSYLQTLAAYENQAKAALNSIHTGIAGSLGSLASGELPSAPDLSGFGILASAIQGLVNTTQGMGQAMGNSVADMGGSMNAITGQINSIAKTFELATEDAQKETVTDVSDADIAEVKSGKVYDCVNTGSVQADLNTGGIVGVMGLEAEADPEDDLNGGGTFSQRRQYELKAIVQNCVNQGQASSKQNYAGGICGRMGLGLITASESYGNVTSTSGDYVGGIVGVVGGTIRGCYAKCTLSGRDYIGGIAGNGVAEDITGGTSLIANCYSMVEIESGKQFLGAISGGESGTYTGNYFVSDSLGGVNRVSYYALAEPISYDDMMRSEAMPRQMRKLTLTFRADGETVKTLSYDYGDSFDHTIYPAIPEKEGHYARWDTADLAELRFDTIVTAEYFPHITSLNSTDVRSNGNPVVFVQGQFQDGDLLKIAPGSADFPARSGQQLLEQWTLSIPADGLESHTIRYLPEEAVTVYLLKSGSWVKAETEEMGSYLAFSVSGAEATFAAIREETNWLMIAGIAAGIVGILAVCVILIRKARKKKQNAAAPHKQKPGKEKILVICAVLLLLVIIAGCILFFLPNTQKAVDTIRAYDILTAYMEQSEQVMELTVDSSISNREVDFSAMIHKTNAANTAVTSITENDRVLYFADSVVFLENGTAYKLNSSVPDYSLVLDQVTEAYSLVDVEAVNDVYTITAADDQATKLLQLLIPTAGDLLTDTNTLTVDLVTIENQLTEIHFTGAGNLADSVKTPFSLSAVIRILPDPAPIDIPAAVGQKLQSGDYQAQEVYSDDLVQLVAAWRNYSAKNPVGAVMTVDTDCGPVALSETFSLYQWKIEDTVIHGIEKADSTAYLSGGTICDGEGRSITTGTAEEMDISKVLDIVYGNFSNATFRCDPNEAGYIYTVTLNQTSMKELTSAIVPAAAELDISYEDGSIQLVIENDEIQSIFITFGGSTQVAIAQVDVHINVLLEMMDGTIGIELPDAVRNTFLPIKE